MNFIAFLLLGLIAGCVGTIEVEEMCGNGQVDVGEECDLNNLGNASCADLGYVGGTLLCASDCRLDATLCTPPPLCGNGNIDAGESCDGMNLGTMSCADFGYVGGQLACTPACRYDLAGCTTAPLCGNGAIDGGEECDGANLGGKSCGDFGFIGGVLSCSAACTFDVSTCNSSPECGNGIVDAAEECDGINFSGLTCSDFGYTGGALTCTAACTISYEQCLDRPFCGNGAIDSGEQCDGNNLGGQQCSDFGFDGGLLGCTAQCTIDTQGCSSAAYCGNSTIDAGEQCDGTNLGGNTCQSMGFEGGVLSCYAYCQLDTSGCFQPPPCGNGVLDAGEECDGSQMGGADCIVLGFSGGFLTCTGDCSYDTSNCTNINDCTAPDPAQPWIQEYQQDILSRLTGEQPLPSGETLSQRCTDSQRELARGYLHSVWQEYGLETFLHEYSYDGANPYAVLYATVDTDEWVIFGAHFDSTSTSPGADDNGSGTTLVLAIARYASMLPCRSKNLMFVGFDEEEIGLVGSYEFAEWVADEGYNVHSVHNFDMVGYDSDDDRKVHLGRPSSGLFNLYEDVVDQNALDISLQETSYGSSDHVAFLNYGFTTTLVAEEWSSDSSPYIHSSRDDYDTIDFGYLESNTILINALIAELTRVESL